MVEDFAQKWALDPEEFRYMVASFNPDLENQPGEDALKKSADFEQYKAKTENPVSRLRYWREVKEAYTKMITEDVLPLRVGDMSEKIITISLATSSMETSGKYHKRERSDVFWH